MTTLTPAGVPRLLACSVNFRPVNLHNYMSQFPKINLSLSLSIYIYTHTPPIGSISLKNPNQYNY